MTTQKLLSPDIYNLNYVKKKINHVPTMKIKNSQFNQNKLTFVFEATIFFQG